MQSEELAMSRRPGEEDTRTEEGLEGRPKRSARGGGTVLFRFRVSFMDSGDELANG